jgi:hypothetical protein
MPFTLPSKSNTYGSLAGLVAGIVTTKLVTVGTVAAIAAFTGFPPASVTMLITALVATVVNYGVTHVAELKTINGMIPQEFEQYPQDIKGPATPNNLQRPQ